MKGNALEDHGTSSSLSSGIHMTKQGGDVAGSSPIKATGPIEYQDITELAKMTGVGKPGGEPAKSMLDKASVIGGLITTGIEAKEQMQNNVASKQAAKPDTIGVEDIDGPKGGADSYRKYTIIQPNGTKTTSTSK